MEYLRQILSPFSIHRLSHLFKVLCELKKGVIGPCSFKFSREFVGKPIPPIQNPF